MAVKQKTEPKNIRLAFYFVLLVIFIISVSLVFKVVDIFRHSKFDGKHSFSVAVFESDNTDIIFASPSDGSLTRLTISPKIAPAKLTNLGIPTDGIITSASVISSNPKSTFTRAILRRGSIKTDLTILDLIRLSLFSQGVGGSNLTEERVNLSDPKISDLTAKLFVDPTIENEKITVLVTNATQVPGLGNKIARYITDMGCNVVLVNSSPNPVKQSTILYKTKSYTVNRLSKILGMKKELKTTDTISDVTIIIGEDKANF